jgi:hypothetical protein
MLVNTYWVAHTGMGSTGSTACGFNHHGWQHEQDTTFIETNH